MKYQSKIFGRVEWPWWHDALIIGAVFLAIFVATKVFS